MLLIVFMLRFQRGFARILGNPERKFTQRWFRDRQEYRSIYKKKTRVKRSRRTWKVLIFDDRWRCDNFDHWRCCDFFSQLSFDCLTSKLSHRNYNGVFVRAAAWKREMRKKRLRTIFFLLSLHLLPPCTKLPKWRFRSVTSLNGEVVERRRRHRPTKQNVSSHLLRTREIQNQRLGLVAVGIANQKELQSM